MDGNNINNTDENPEIKDLDLNINKDELPILKKFSKKNIFKICISAITILLIVAGVFIFTKDTSKQKAIDIGNEVIKGIGTPPYITDFNLFDRTLKNYCEYFTSEALNKTYEQPFVSTKVISYRIKSVNRLPDKSETKTFIEHKDDDYVNEDIAKPYPSNKGWTRYRSVEGGLTFTNNRYKVKNYILVYHAKYSVDNVEKESDIVVFLSEQTHGKDDYLVSDFYGLEGIPNIEPTVSSIIGKWSDDIYTESNYVEFKKDGAFVSSIWWGGQGTYAIKDHKFIVTYHSLDEDKIVTEVYNCEMNINRISLSGESEDVSLFRIIN